MIAAAGRPPYCEPWLTERKPPIATGLPAARPRRFEATRKSPVIPVKRLALLSVCAGALRPVGGIDEAAMPALAKRCNIDS